MTMIIKATKVKSIRHADMLATHLLRTDENEYAQVQTINGTARPDDLTASLRSMQRATDLTKGKTGLFHVAINPRDHEADQMTPEQWERTLQAIEDEFLLHGQPCAIVEHRKNGRTHLHAVWQLTDTDKGKLIDVKNDHYRCQTLGRSLEQEFDHERTNNAPSRDTYTRDEQQQAKRLGEDLPDRRQALRDDYAQAKDLDEFRELLAAKGYSLAKGDRAGVVLVHENGEVFGMARELGIKAAEVKKLLGAEIKHLPSVENALNAPKMTVEQSQCEKAPLPPANDNQAQQPRQDEPQSSYQQQVTVNFDIKGFEAAKAAHQLSEQQRQEQAERDRQERIAQRLKEWDEQQTQRQQRNHNKGLNLDR